MRFLLSLLAALALGIGVGLYLGWVQFPVIYAESPASRMAQRYQDDYTTMVAAGFSADGDLNGAVNRLRLLGVANIPAHVQETTERYITTSQRLDDIRALVTLAGAVGRLTPIMEPYRIAPTGVSS